MNPRPRPSCCFQNSGSPGGRTEVRVPAGDQPRACCAPAGPRPPPPQRFSCCPFGPPAMAGHALLMLQTSAAFLPPGRESLYFKGSRDEILPTGQSV